MSIRTQLWSLFSLLRYQFDIVVHAIFGLYYGSPKKPLPDAEDSFLLDSAVSISRKIKSRQLKCEDVVTAFIKRIKQVNESINAVVDNRFDDAIKEARLIDLNLMTGEIQEIDYHDKPFFGVPFTSKESTACKGLSCTFGLVARKNRKSSFDADVIARMKAAGGILIAVTNIPQFNLWQETSNPLFGTTRNPYDLNRNVGGSSGGEGATISSGGSALGIGTDIGGSLRIPAFMCGIFGHKPTSDLISTAGLTFRTGREINTMVVAGPMVKYAEDITPALKVLLGENQKRLKLDKPVDFKTIQIHYVDQPKDPFVSPFRDEMKQIFNKVVNHFAENSNVKPHLLECESLAYGGKLWRYWMTQEPNFNFNSDITDRQKEINSLMEIVKYTVGRSNFNLAIVFNLLGAFLPNVDAKWAKETTEELRKILIKSLGSDGVLLYPSAPWVPSYHYSAFLSPWNFNLMAVWNVLKFPVTQVPLGLSKDGLPFGIQIVAAPYQDHLAIRIAIELENAFGGYVPPFRVKPKE